MRLSNLVKFLEGHWLLQVVLTHIHLLLFLIYIGAYMSDLMSVAGSLAVNDRNVGKDYDAGILKEVSLFEDNGDGSYSIQIDGGESTVSEVKLGSLVYSVYVEGADWYYMAIPGGVVMYQTKCDFVDSIAISGSVCTVGVGEVTFSVPLNEKLLDVWLNEDGLYEIRYVSDKVPFKTLDYLSSVQVLLKDNDTYRIKLSTSYTNVVRTMDIGFCRVLPTDNIYYNEVNKGYIRNISEDFAATFLIGGNIAVVFVCYLGLAFLFMALRQGKRLVSCDRVLVILTWLCVVALGIAVLLTVLLL